jgi:hypothetical protein
MTTRIVTISAEQLRDDPAACARAWDSFKSSERRMKDANYMWVARRDDGSIDLVECGPDDGVCRWSRPRTQMAGASGSSS